MACNKQVNTNESPISSFTEYTWLFWKVQKQRLVDKLRLEPSARTKTSLLLSEAKFECLEPLNTAGWWVLLRSSSTSTGHVLEEVAPESWPLPRIWRIKSISCLSSCELLVCLILLYFGWLVFVVLVCSFNYIFLPFLYSFPYVLMPSPKCSSGK